MIDLEKLRKVYKFSRSITISDALALFKATRRKTYQPGEVIIRAGSTKREMFLIRKGLVRCYAINAKGVDITISLRCEHQLFGNHDAILFERPLRFYFEALEPTDLLTGNFDRLQEIEEQEGEVLVSSVRSLISRGRHLYSEQRTTGLV